jgi:hypothetical protein
MSPEVLSPTGTGHGFGNAGMFVARVRVSGDETDWFPGDYEMATIPPVGAYLRIMDRNANRWWLRVVGVELEAMAMSYKEAFPNSSGRTRWVVIYGEDAGSNPHTPGRR